ncbi:MAG: hypothetical protein AW10_01415 [Candidatus Accumulibacter appositus]|uniref:Uncharacterized protein n=1 Tax=Candidatus Accumulibacter appositus TaxID=1454003 RepID=A0A011PVK9_9PROT|nr:MAG: hypothetical protein AW10_01415 [Candidatus Accumulibacter appositus]
MGGMKVAQEWIVRTADRVEASHDVDKATAKGGGRRPRCQPLAVPGQVFLLALEMETAGRYGYAETTRDPA